MEKALPSSLSPTSSELLVLLLFVLSVDIRRSKGEEKRWEEVPEVEEDREEVPEVEVERLISSREEAREEEEEEWERPRWFLRERNCIRRCLGFFTVYLVKY